MIKKVFYFFLSFILTLGLSSYIQEEYFESNHIFPFYNEFIPDSISDLEKFISKSETKPKQALNKTNLFAGNNYEYLQSIFKKLNDLETKKSGMVRILHFGDSMLWSDMITAKIKEKFQSDFGDGGRGLVPITNQQARSLLFHKNFTNESQFTQKNLDHRQSVNPQLGFLGEAAILNYPFSSLKHELGQDSKPWKRVELYYRSNSGSNPNIKAYYSKVLEKSLLMLEEKDIVISTSDACSKISLSFDESTFLNLELSQFAYPYPVLDAINFETEFGIAYSTVSRKGIEVGDLLLIDEQSFSCGFANYQPDLIVLQFGVNESENLARKAYITPESYRKNLEDVIIRFKKKLPNTNILLIAPIERISKNERGEYRTMPEILLIRETQRELAEMHKVAFFDSYEALGGEGQNDILYENGFMQPDKTHLTRKGGEFFAQIFYSDFSTHYKKYKGIVEETKNSEIEELRKEKNQAVNFVSKAYFYFFIFVWLVSASLTRYPELKIGFLAFVSFYFYATWNFYALGIILGSTIIDYICGIQIFKSQLKGGRGSFYLILSLVFNLSVLFFFKYYDFLIGLINGIKLNGSSLNIPLLHFLLPVGISFYTFQTLSYTIDIWRKKLSPEKGFVRFAQYVAFFPQLVAGPIVRANEFLPGLKNRGEHFKLKNLQFSGGIFQVCVGILKKIIADRLAFGIVDGVYANPEMYSSFETLIGIYAYGIQIYFDFSGYSDIAIGSAKILGYRLTLNFDRPYTSFSVTDFWRRWHISLGSWFRDYLYIPLGGNRNLVFRNLLITFIFCGIWHGAGIPFFIWGLYHGSLLILERILGIDKKANIITRIITLHLVLFGWVIFRSDNWNTFRSVIENLNRFSVYTNNLENWIIIIVAFYFIYELFGLKLVERMRLIWLKTNSIAQGSVVAFVILISYYLHKTEVKPFIYFQF